MAQFFIDRPIFAWVIAVLVMLAGGIALQTLPVSQYLSIAPPSISISASYPGASAQTLQAGQKMNFGISVQERLQTPEQFGDIILRINTDGSLLRVRDVARTELGSENYNAFSRYNGNPSTGLAIKLSTGANFLNTAVAVDSYLKR